MFHFSIFIDRRLTMRDQFLAGEIPRNLLMCKPSHLLPDLYSRRMHKHLDIISFHLCRRNVILATAGCRDEISRGNLSSRSLRSSSASRSHAFVLLPASCADAIHGRSADHSTCWSRRAWQRVCNRPHEFPRH